MDSDGPYSGLVEEFFVVPVRVIGFQLASSEVVIPKPDNSPRQQERVFITSGISDLWTSSSINGFLIHRQEITTWRSKIDTAEKLTVKIKL